MVRRFPYLQAASLESLGPQSPKVSTAVPNCVSMLGRAMAESVSSYTAYVFSSADLYRGKGKPSEEGGGPRESYH